MHITKPSTRRVVVSYSRAFDYEGHEGWGFWFPCDEAGNLTNPNPDAARNLAECLTGRVKTVQGERSVVDRGIVRSESTVRDYAEGQCDDCGEIVTLYGFTNTCQCGADYNLSGQRLAPRSQWGEETGESISDILQADGDPWGDE